MSFCQVSLVLLSTGEDEEVEIKGGPSRVFNTVSEIEQLPQNAVWNAELGTGPNLAFLHQPNDIVQTSTWKEVATWECSQLLPYCEASFSIGIMQSRVSSLMARSNYLILQSTLLACPAKSVCCKPIL